MVFYTVNLYMYTCDLFHILLYLLHTYGSMECTQICMHVCVVDREGHLKRFESLSAPLGKLQVSDKYMFYSILLLSSKFLYTQDFTYEISQTCQVTEASMCFEVDLIFISGLLKFMLQKIEESSWRNSSELGHK